MRGRPVSADPITGLTPEDTARAHAAVAEGDRISVLAKEIALELGMSREMAVELESRLYDKLVSDRDHEIFVNDGGSL